MEDNTYKVLTPDEAIAYVKTFWGEFATEKDLAARRLSGSDESVDGHVNVITIVYSQQSGKSVVIKQMMPYLKTSVRADMYALALARIASEVNSLKFWDTICPGLVPKIYFWDERNNIVLMEDLSRLKILSAELLKRKRFPKLPEQMGAFLGKTAFYTSDLFLNIAEKKKLKYMFTTCNTKPLWENFIFNFPILLRGKNRISSPIIKQEIDAFCGNWQIRQETLRLRNIYVDKKQCLIHSDLHTSNVLLAQDEMKVFDSEYATYGPISFDIGRLLGSLVLSYAALFGTEMSEEERTDYQSYLLSLIANIYIEFSKTFRAEWDNNLAQDNDYQSQYNYFCRQSVLQETVGFIACAALSRIYDEGLPFDFKKIADLQQRAKGQRFIIKLAEKLLLNRKHINVITDFTEIIQELTKKYEVILI